MSYQVLARKWRPKTFQQLVGQEAIVQALVNGLDNDRVHHAFLFTGTRGVGKTTIARILAKCLNCDQGVSSTPCGECPACMDIDDGRFQDLLEIDAASKTGVDNMRDLTESAQFAPARGRYKVYLIDEVHMLSKPSFNALLKTLEEPPPHVKFVLATTDPGKIPVTVLSRCLRFNLRRLLPGEIGDYLQMLLGEEDIEAELPAVTRIARAADGSMRDALSLLDQAIAFGGGRLRDDDVAQMMGSVDHEHIATLLRALAEGDAAAILPVVAELADQSRDLEGVLGDLSEVLHRVGLVQLVPKYTDPERSDWDSVRELAELLSPEDVQLYYQIALHGRRDLGLAPDPRTGLEMVLLRMIAFRPASANSGQDGDTGPDAGQEREDAAGTGSVSKQGAGTSPQPTAAAPPSVPAPDAASSGPAVSLPEQGTPNWTQLITQLELSGPVKELARNLQLENRDGSDWRFLIPEEVQYLGSKRLVNQLQSALSHQLGETVNLALNAVETAVATPAVASEQAERRQLSDAERAIEEDPTVRSLKERLGARILQDSIQPLQ